MSSLQQELERSFGEGPAHRPVQETLRSGRRALRRRRVAATAGALAVLASIGTGYAVSLAGPEPRTTGEVVTDPTPSPSPTEATDPEPTEPAWRDGVPVRYDGDRVLEVRPGVVVHERIRNPYGYEGPFRSEALDLTFEGQRLWYIIELTRDGAGTFSSTPSNGWASFADWVADQVDGTTGGDDGWPDTVRLTADGTVVASEGIEILQRTDDPQLGESFAEPGTPTGAALVQVDARHQAYFVVWRVIGGELDVLTPPPGDVVGATFEELLSYARSQYASGEGPR